MSAGEVLEILEKDGMAEGVTLDEGPKDASLVVPRERLLEVCRHLKTSRALHFAQCILVTGTHFTERLKKDGSVDRPEHYVVLYHLRSIHHHRLLAVKVRLEPDDLAVPSLVELWPAANWHERETFDMLGIDFRGHPDLKRILLPDDWEGHPLRKDYVFPKEYHGISLEVDPPWPT